MLLTERLMIKDRNVLFWEEHYFRLMASMRILRIAIPMCFTPDYLQNQVIKVLEANSFREGLALFSFFEARGEICFLIIPSSERSVPFWDETVCHIDLFNEYKLTPRLLSNLSFHILPELHLAMIHAKEYHYDDVILINTQNRIVRTLEAHIFLIKSGEIYTPKAEEGCEKTVVRKKFIEHLRSIGGRTVFEAEIFPYELQAADEVFLLLDWGIRPVHSYRKKTYEMVISKEIFKTLCQQIS